MWFRGVKTATVVGGTLALDSKNDAFEEKNQSFQQIQQFGCTTVDGSEIRLTSWGKGSLSRYVQGFYTSQVVSRISSINNIIFNFIGEIVIF